MIKRIENAFLNSLASHSNIASENREVYLYGLDLLLYTLLSTMGLIGLGLLWGKPLESVLYSFILSQSKHWRRIQCIFTQPMLSADGGVPASVPSFLCVTVARYGYICTDSSGRDRAAKHPAQAASQ